MKVSLRCLDCGQRYAAEGSTPADAMPLADDGCEVCGAPRLELMPLPGIAPVNDEPARVLRREESESER